MAVKIVKKPQKTTVTKGQVSATDLKKMKSDFKGALAPSKSITYGTGKKQGINVKQSFYFTKEQFLFLFSQTPADAGVKLTLGVKMAGMSNLCGDDESNDMCMIVETFRDRKNRKPNGKFVLINGYQTNGKKPATIVTNFNTGDGATPKGSTLFSLNIATSKMSDADCCPSSDPPGNT